MLSGPTKNCDIHETEENRELIKSFISEVLINNNLDLLDDYVNTEEYIEHNMNMSDGLSSLRNTLTLNIKQRKYDKIHHIMAEGSFVLCITEGFLDQVHISFYDLFRISNGLIVEQWVNNNGKFNFQ